MPESLLWINKDCDSTVLSRSNKAETRQIRKHVQHERQLKAKAAQAQAHEAAGRPRRHASPTHATAGAAAPKKANPPAPRGGRGGGDGGGDGGGGRGGGRGLRLDTNVDHHNQNEPEQQQLALLSASASPTSRANRISQAIQTFPGLAPEESRSLVFFCQRTAPEWSGWRDASFWNKLILQACYLNPSILHGVVALGALHESSEVDGESDERSDLQELALHQSSKASRMAFETTMSDITALISCIIFICLQNLQDSRTAYQLLKSGHNLITDIDRRLGSGELILADSEQTVLNNFLRPIIERLRMRFCSIVDVPSALALSAALKRTKTDRQPTPDPEVPVTFTNLLEARNKLEEISEWAQENVDPDSADGRPQTAALLSMWQLALERSGPEKYAALTTSKMLLKAAALVAAILFDTLGTQSECSYDRHIDKFAEIMHLYRGAIGDPARPPRKVSFGIDSGVIDTLAFVAGRCRDPVIRRSAIDLLKQTNRTEGDLQGITGSTILTRLMELEEDGLVVMSAADVPETQRLRIWEDHQYWDRGEIQIFFVAWPYDPALGAEIKTASVQFPVKDLRVSKEGALPGSLTGLPNVKYGRGAGAFLEEGSQRYHHITLSSFFMPMPRL